LGARLRALSPASTLDRGYAIVTVSDGEIVRDPDQGMGDRLRDRPRDEGRAGAGTAAVVLEHDAAVMHHHEREGGAQLPG
ncbi:MAG: Exonuclease large subunit, partial [Actinomycetota bacterium]